MPLSPGTLLGSYEIVALIGAGGMGEVYRARDTKLQRDVAIKVLSSALAHAPDALERFEREALSVAKLSHPNILAIYGFAHDGPRAYVVTELVDGETLRARLEQGGLPPRRAVGYALQIARGVAAAHARGLVHRDLKPENVMITRDDHVKILDFGLAKAIAPAETEMTQAGGTNAGTILGTFAYMAPEQVRGLAIDHRADIFAFGAVLYEMLSGERAFKGETAADTMTAILTKEPPDLDSARLSISPGLDRIIRRCVEKSPDLRFQSATDLAFALETLSTGSGTPPVPARAVPWLPWGIAVVASIAAVATWFLKPAPAPLKERWQQFSPITDAAGEETSPTISPDGTTVAYAMRVNGNWDIYGQRVGGRNATPIVSDASRDESAPAFSPDGASIAFHELDDDGGIFVVGATGESERRLTDAGFDPGWSPDGKRIAFATEEVSEPSSRQGISVIQIVDAAGGAPKPLGEGDAVQPSWSPSGERIVYWSNTAGQRDIYTIAVSGGARVPVTQDAAIDWAPVWSPDGKYVYFSSDRGGAMNVWRIAVDQATGKTSGDVEPVTTGVQASAALVRFAQSGSRFVFRSRVAAVDPALIPFDPATLRTGPPVVLDGSNNVRVPSDISPDGKQVAYFSIGERQEDIFISGIDGKGMRRITDDASRDRAAVFTPDGRSLVFYSTRGGQWEIWTIRTDGSNLRKLGSTPGGALYPQVSPRGDSVVFSASDVADGVFRVPFMGGTIEKLAMKEEMGRFYATDWSPDGTKLVGPVASTSGRVTGVAVYDLRDQSGALVADDATYGPRFLPDSRRLLYLTEASELVVLDTVTRQRTVVPIRLSARPVTEGFALSADGRAIIYGGIRAESDIWIAEKK